MRNARTSQSPSPRPSPGGRGRNAYKNVADYYDAENERLEMLRHDVPFFLSKLPKKKQSILELAVGTARAAIPIAQAGHEVVGVERDPAMLAIARRKRDSVGLTDRELKLIRGDVLTMKLRRRFDIVCIFFNTMLAFTTLEQQDRLLQNVRRHLKPAGRFWLDIFQPDHSLLARSYQKRMESSIFFVPALDRTVEMSVDVRRDMSRQWMEITFNYKWFNPRRHGRERRERARFEMTAIFPRELRLLLERNGLRIDKFFGNYDGSRLKASSPRMIASCRIA